MTTQEAPFLSEKDLKQFLASCEEEDEVGVPDWSTGCLAAEALKWKYGKDHEFCILFVNTRFEIYSKNTCFEIYSERYEQTGWIDPDVKPLLDEFDQISNGDDYPWYHQREDGEWPAVTKAQLRAIDAFEELFVEEGQQ